MESIRWFAAEHPRIVFGTAAAILFGTSMALKSPPDTDQRKLDFKNQSIKIEGAEGIRVSALNDIKNGEFFKVYDEFENLYDSFLGGEKKIK